MSERRDSALAAQAAAACVALALSGVVEFLFAPLCFGFVVFKRTVLDRTRFCLPDLVFVLAHAALFVCFLLFAIFNELAHDDLAVLLGFMVLWMLLRTFAESTPYNDFLIVLAAMVISVGSAAVAPGFVPAVITAAYIVTTCYTLPTIMTRARRDDGVRVRLLSEPGRWAVAAGFAVHHLALAGLLIGSVIYLAVPRLMPESDAPDLEAAEQLRGARERRLGAGRTGSGTTRMTGFPDTVRLGDIGEIKRSDRLAFEVHITRRGGAYSPAPGEPTLLLLRADAWDAYDPATRSWTRWQTKSTRLPADGRVAEGRAEMEYRMHLLATDGRKLFLPQQPLRVRADTPLSRDELGRILSPAGVTKYAVESARPPTAPAEVRRLRPTNGRLRLREVDPALFRELLPYAREIGLDARPEPGRIFHAVESIRLYFERKGFRYTLQLPSFPKDTDPVIAFLERREGHCELFASAACLLLRMAQIPARLAGGVRCAEEIGRGHYRARMRNAHAWVEIATDDEGFVAFDFTPPDTRAEAPQAGPQAGATAGPDEAGGAGGGGDGIDWRHPFRYGHNQQRELVRLVGGVVTVVLLPLAGLAMLVAMAVAVWRRPRARRNGLRVSAPQGVSRRALGFYVHWLKECAAAGYRRRTSQTPREFVRQLPKELAESGREITARFEQIRYGGSG